MQNRNCQFIHLRLTESLLCSLENVKQKGGKISLVCDTQKNPIIIATISGLDSVYELEPDHSTTYFSFVNIKKSVGKYLQNIQYRYRTKATDDSFVKARENLVKEVENSRQQKIKALDYQLKSALSIKDERITKARKNLKRNLLSGPPSKIAKISEDTDKSKKSDASSNNSSVLNILSKKKTVHVFEDLSNDKTKVSAKKGKQNIGRAAEITEKCSNEVEKTIHGKCLLAIQRRKALEQRLQSAYENTDEFLKVKEIEKIKVDLCSLIDDLYTDELLRKWVPLSIKSA
ncbi:hypothetical protein MN116_002755 [Schistosoma mekongi]|uniref:Uncharacterized protein n=1 Tax=Schistosoma mekongi TaxID=38744 RepID=A0AAE2D7U9_SCHME|nr:hypothetical protein MN116_002755 [Schistosoma mekongi]